MYVIYMFNFSNLTNDNAWYLIKGSISAIETTEGLINVIYPWKYEQ
jgi:hypothetical protein